MCYTRAWIASKIATWLIFVETNANEDVERIRTCERRDVTKFGLPHLLRAPAPPFEWLHVRQTSTITISVDL